MGNMKKIMIALAIAVLAQAMPSLAASVIRDGKEWLQPADFVDISWAEADAACPLASARQCTGVLGGIDVTGFTFASIAEVNSLMATYGVPQPDLCGGSAGRVDGSTWVPLIFADFSPTAVDPGARFLEGNVSDADICAAISDPNCIGSSIGFLGIQSDDTLGDGYCAGPGSISTGVWLYRGYLPTPLAVPGPGLPAMLLAGLGMLYLAFRHRSRTRAGQE